MPVKAPAAAVNFGRFEIVARIAEGGMGTVYRAHDPRANRDVALKVLLPEVARNPIIVQRFRREFEAARTLEHPHLVRALEFGEADQRFFIVMEFVEGISLGEQIERHGPLAEAEAIRLISQVAQALHHAHGRGFLHRDVKPDNILVTAEGVARLTDLGLVKQLDADQELTRAGKGLGTPNFMAPEQLADAKTVDQRADVYGLAATLYIAVTGELPFRSRGYLGVFRKKTAGDVRPPRALVPGLSVRLDRAVLRALSAAPTERPATCLEFVAELTDLARESKPNRSAQTRVLPTLAKKERRATVRYPSQAEGVCLPLHGAEVRWAAQVRDISAGGLSLLVNRRFEPGTVLLLEFPGDHANRPGRLLVRVVRLEQLSKRKWALGCKFGRGLGEEEVKALR